MEKIKENSGLKKFRKIFFRTIIGLILLLLLLSISLSLPFVQTQIAHYATEKLNKEFGTNINIDEVAVTVFGGVKLKKVLVLDHHKDTMIYATRIKTNILDFQKLIDGKLIFGDLRLDDLFFRIQNYKNEKHSNFDLFVEAFDDGKPGSGKFLFTAQNAYLTNSRFVMIDENGESPKDVDFFRINAHLKNFKIKGSNVTSNIDQMSFKDFRGVEAKNLTADFTYTRNKIILDHLKLKTNESFVKGRIALKYNLDNKDFGNFNNRVKFDIKLDSASVSTNDIRYFYDEMGKNRRFFMSSEIKGTLNDFYATHLYLRGKQNAVIKGDVNFKNLFGHSPGKFYMKGDFDKISSNYQSLTQLLPNILGKKLPSVLKKLGQFNYTGKAEVTQEYIITNFVMKTALGIVESDLKMSNLDNIDRANYKGNVILDDFDVGTILNDKTIGKVSLNLDVDGEGFTQKFLNTTLIGDIYRLKYNGYNYSKIIVDGSFKYPIYKGKVFVNDPNLFMDFSGILDLTQKENIYDFHAKIDYANLNQLKFITDSISVFKGDIVIKAKGNSVDNLKGDFWLTNASYQNTKDLYFVDYLNINSAFDDYGERSIVFTSEDAIKGSVVGKYKFNQIQKMAENCLGSFYANYRPHKVLPNQYLKFNFTFNSKLIEIFNPNISLSNSTTLKGNISSESKNFKLDLTSPEIVAYNNTFDNLLLKIDNRNPLYSSYIQLDSIKTKRYKISDFSMINAFAKDTLQFRAEFKGGKKGTDFYNLNFYHTINKENKNVVGFKKSELQFKNRLWYLNENENKENNKVVFDKKMNGFSFENLILSHENESLGFAGFISGKQNKDLQLTFENVDLNKITPDVDKFRFEGNVNGKINFKQNKTIFQPSSSLKIDNLCLNDIALGVLKLDIEGDESLRKFYVNSTLNNEYSESLSAEGDIEIADNQTFLDIDLTLDKFNLGILDKIGGDVIKNIRGFASGTARIDGEVNDLDYNGRLFVTKAGLTVPYLNADYEFEKNSVVDVTQDKFIIRETNITDTKFNTNGLLAGYIKHKQFGDWQLDLSVTADRLLALNTVDHEDAAYFGTAYMKGKATVKGPTDALLIKVDAESAKGTDIKIPIDDTEAVEESNYIHFLSTHEKLKNRKEKVLKNRNYNGLELEFNLEINDNANVEVILNRESGHGMKGKGSGTLLFRINTFGKFEMWGDFIANEGTYNFKYSGINKTFNVKKGGSITWSGNPMAAVLNLSATYNTMANPAILIDNPAYNKKTNVEVIIDVKGNLANPEPEFNINFPNMSSTLKSEIQYKLDDKDARQKQALYLLAFDNFLNEQGANQSPTSSVAIEKASSVVNSLFQNENDKLQLGIDIVGANKTPNYQADGRVGVSVSSKISDKFTVNGKVGVPVGGYSETTIVGNLEVLYRVNEDGTMNLRVFAKENDLTYIGQGIGYTQGVGMSYSVDFDEFKELVNKLFKSNKLDRVPPKKHNTVQDSDSLPENMHFKKEDEEKEKGKTEPEPNKDAIPIEE